MKYSKLGMRNIISIAVLAILYYLYWTNVAGRLLAEVQFLINYIAIPLSVGLAVHFTCIGDVGTKIAQLLVFPPVLMSTSIWEDSYIQLGVVAIILQFIVMAGTLLVSSFVAKIPRKNTGRPPK